MSVLIGSVIPRFKLSSCRTKSAPVTRGRALVTYTLSLALQTLAGAAFRRLHSKFHGARTGASEDELRDAVEVGLAVLD